MSDLSHSSDSKFRVFLEGGKCKWSEAVSQWTRHCALPLNRQRRTDTQKDVQKETLWNFKLLFETTETTNI